MHFPEVPRCDQSANEDVHISQARSGFSLDEINTEQLQADGQTNMVGSVKGFGADDLKVTD